MRKKVHPPTAYFGGKFGTIGKTIASLLPPHRIYVEPFGGMAGVLFHKQPSLIEVYNDLDSRLVNLFNVLRDKKKARELINLLRLTPFSRDVYNEAHKWLRKGEKDPVELARATMIVLSQAVQPAMRHNGFKNGGAKYESSVAKGWKNKIVNLEAVTERITDWIIENQSAEKLVLRYNVEDALFYCDLPYVHSTRNLMKTTHLVKDYACEMTDVEHEVFLIVARSLKAKVIISGYESELYDRVLEGWHKTKFQVWSGLAASNNNPDDNGIRTEVLYTNFQLNIQQSLFEGETLIPLANVE